MGWKYLSIPKLQRRNHWSLGMNIKLFNPKLYGVCDYLSMLGLKLIHVGKRVLGDTAIVAFINQIKQQFSVINPQDMPTYIDMTKLIIHL